MRYAMAGAAPASVTTTGANVTTTVLPDQSTVVTFLSDGTITLGDAAVISRVLVVGGGGGAGIGGGGGGAVVEVSQGFDGIEPGVAVTVTVGAGGTAGSTMDAGNNGGTSSFGSIVSALGGGGGGAFSYAAKTGGANGGGGGAAQNASYLPGSAAAWASGHTGGNATNNGSSGTGCGGGGGGGGAGADGQNSGVAHTSTNNDQTSESAGNGGDGLESDITGSVVHYGGGGGGGIRRSNFKYGGLGGAGGGGRGFGLTPGAAGGAAGSSTTMTNPQGATAGTDGLGGGGGGGGWDAKGTAFDSGKGGSGVVIVRIDPVAAGPEPQLNIEGVADGPASILVTAKLTNVGDGSSSADVSYAVAESAAALDSATPVVVSTGVLANETVSFAIPGLTAGTTYYVRVLAENTLGETCQSEVFECLPYTDAASVTAIGAAREFAVGRDRVAVFNQSSSTMTFTLAERAAVELLLVGGGGAGGGYDGGGGGAGGFLHVEKTILDAGTYTVAVGAGGAPTTTDQRQGGNGGDTTLSSGGSVLYTAHGGGGGGGYSSSYRNGKAGGSGGGASVQAGVAGASTAADGERGNPGGANDKTHNSLNLGSGGGGAGAPGSHADYANVVGGAGGDGLPCSITGEEVWYAGGGGAGQNSDAVSGLVFSSGFGGRGGGGMGCRTADNVLDDYECGTDGLGGGGGGGRKDGDNAAAKPRRGAPGGSGTLIVRWQATAHDTARATVDSVVGSVAGAIVSGSVDFTAAGAAGASLEMAVGPTGGSLGSYETLGSGLQAGERFVLTLSGLTEGTAYDYAVRVVSGGVAGEVLGAATGTFTTFTSGPARLSGMPDGAVKTMVGTDSVYSFSTPGTYTFTVSALGRARFLMVGGGGAGGTNRGGGGGAGGLIEMPTVTLEPGTYTVVVGAGGAVSSVAGYGGDGEDTVLRLAGTVLYTAHGGGGGAYGSSELLAGHAGGSGGGGNACTASQSESTAVSPELGNPGGKGSGLTSNGNNNAAAGGGGAGGSGADAHSSDAASGTNRRQGGNGGPGVASDITGETLYYAGGGGGSCWCDENGGYKGLGGSGVGGDGGGYTTEVNQNRTNPTAGASGTGSGGGGGCDFSNSGESARRGAAGGCGAFILRLAADAAAELPEVVLESLSAGATSVDAILALRNSGSAVTADLSLLYGMAEDTLDLSAPVATGAAPGLYTTAVSGLAPGRTWFFAPVASNAGGVSTGAVQSVTLPAAGALPAGDGSSGLWQISRRTSATAFPTVFTNASLWADATVSNIVSGALAANTRSYLFSDPATGLTYVSPGTPVLFAYRGWIYLEGGKTYVFGSRYADSVYLAIDGETVLYVSKAFKSESFGTFETEEAGWHEIDLRVGHTTDNFGPDGDGTASWASFGVAFNANGSTTPMPESNWTPILDDGSGSLLRPSRPETRILSLTGAAASGGTLTLNAVVGSGENTAHAWLVYGVEDAGTASIVAWEHSTDLGEVAASAGTTALAAQVAGWGSAITVARLVLETDGQLAWTEPVTYSATTLPQVFDALVSGYALGDRAIFRATVVGGTAPYTATLLVGTAADSLAVVATTNLAVAGIFSFGVVSGLVPGAQHFYQVVVTDESGATARSEVLSFVTPGASRVYDFSDVNLVDRWNDGNPFENRQRTLVAGGTLSELGAGETTVRLLRNQGYYAFPAGNKTEPHEGEELVVSATGSYTLPVLLDWDLDVAWNWSVSNATETASWGPTAQIRDSQSWARNTTIVDATTYTWKGGDGLWTDQDQWSPDGVWDDIAGYPRRGSYAVFPAGTAVVSVPDTALTNRFSSLTIPTGADVTFQPADGATDATLRMQIEDKCSATRGYAFSLGKNAALRFKGEGLFVDLYGNTAMTFGDTDSTIEFTDGVRAKVGNGTGGGAINANVKARSLIAFRNGAQVTVNGFIIANGVGTQIVIDDATVIEPYAAANNNGVFLRGKTMDGKATLVIKGAHPILKCGYRFATSNSDSPDTTQYVDFEVPEGGWEDAPIRTDPANVYKFGESGTSGYKIHLRVPATSPAVVAGESLDVPLVRWPKGIHSTYVTLDSANLPHPATDSFFQTTDPVTGQITVWAHLVGQADTAAPQASDFRVRSLAQTGANLSFVVIPGSGGATSVSAEVLDANGDAVAGASVSPASASFSAAGTNVVTVAGLDPATAYTLRVTLDDGTNPAVTADFAFNSLDDWAEGHSDTAASVVQDGPYTVWTFTDTTVNAATFAVTRAGLAEILVVGGGGSGGSGVNNDNSAGGGGGGGGQVISATTVLVPGIYPITVGKGAARVSSRVAGTSGSASAFGDMVAAGGGGGGYNTTAGLSGGNGGGGAHGKGGGAGTGGYAGGAGVSSGGGGGGGGATAAGASGASKTGGAGGAGFESSISGYPAVYGAGGGGGGGGTYGSGLNIGGAAGGDTAGVGASRNVDFRYGTAASTMNAAPGYGGGGGGGCGSSNGETAHFGGAGASGTVIVRMRTATAADPAPQAAIKGVEIGEADWTASLVVYSLGQGADEVEVTLRVARDGAATTNDFPMAGTISANGAVVRTATGLAPSSDYDGVLLLNNGLAGGTLEIPVAFRTADPAATTVAGGAVWDYGAWTSAAADFHDGNLLRGSLPAVTVASTGADGTPANLARAVNGADDDLRLVNDRLYMWMWENPVYLTSFRIFYKHSTTTISAVNVASVEALGADGEWHVISPEPGHYMGGQFTRGYLLPAAGATALWDQPAYGIRFTSDGNMSTSDHYLREVEAEGIPVANLPADISITSLSRTAAGVKALVAFSHELPAAATVMAYVATTHGGTDVSAWITATNVTVEAGALSQNFSIDATSLDGMDYLRFCSDDGNGGVRWSETVYLPDVEVLASIPPVVLFVAARDTMPASVTLAASLVDAGSGATNERADLYVRYAAQSNEVEGATAHLVAENIPEGETAAVLDGLLPDRLYWAQFVARNAGGDTGASDPFSFATAPDEIGGGAASAINGWYCDTWSTSTASTTNNLLRGLIGTETTGPVATSGSLQYLTDGRIDESGKNWAPGPGTSVEFELGGTFSLSEFRLYQYVNDGTRRKISIASLEWRDEAGEWHRIAGSQLEFDVAEYNRAFLTPADGAPFLAVGATAFRFTQGEGGGVPATHPIREMELLGVSSGGYRILTVDAASWSAGTLTATVSRPITNAVGTIHAVSGEAYHGTDAAAWAADGNDAVFGSAAADQVSVAGTFAPAAGAAYVRFYEADGNGAIVAWSDTIPADASAVRVVDGGVDADGDTAVFPVRVVSAGSGNLSVTIQLADDPDFTSMTNIVVANPGIGAFSIPVAVEPGGTYWYRIVAETTDGGFDETPVVSFTTRAGSVLASGVSTPGAVHRFVTLNGTLETLGAGVTTLEILIGDSHQALEVYDTVVLDRAGAFSIPVMVTGMPRTVYYAFHTVNVAPGGTTWESWSSVSANNTFTTYDAVTYTWKTSVTEGAWNDPANWTPNVSYYCTGYPANSQATVDFPNGTVATIAVPGKYRFANWSVFKQNLDVTLVGEGPDVSGFGGSNDNMGGGAFKNCNWTFSGVSLTEKDGVNFGDTSSYNSTLRFTDGAVASFGNNVTGVGSNMWLVVDNGASLTFRAGGPRMGMKFGGIRLDGGTIGALYLYTDYNWNQTTNQTIRVSGEAPQITLSTAFRNESTAAASLQNADTTFLFSVPKDGWVDPVIYSENEGEKFAGLLGDGAGGYVLAIDPESPVFQTGRKCTVQLVAWKGGIDTSHVTLVDPPKSTMLFYTYGWPSVLAEPENVGDSPTGVRAEIPGAPGFKLFVR
jgi:hypothetical protein